jgi:sRNA-binding protein
VEKHHLRYQRRLAERWPHLFTFAVPLKVGIHKDYPAPGERPLAMKRFNSFLYHWVRQPEYRKQLREGKARYGFDGSMYPIMEGERDGR